MASSPRVAVIVVNYNGGSIVERCVEALGEQTLAPHRVIVVDNASTDGSPDAIAARFPEVELVRLDENVGFAAANNLAARRADDCDWLALLNPDAFPEPRWLEELVRAADENPDYTFFASRLVRANAPELDGTGDVYHVSGMAWRRDEGEPATAVRAADEVFSACAAAALYRRDVFLAAGGFDASFFCYYEDTDLAFRLRLAGHRCLYVPDAIVRHVGFGSSGELSEFTIYHSHRNSVWTYARNMPSPLLWVYLPQHLLVNAVDVASAALRGRAAAAGRAKRDAVCGLPRVLAERRRLQRARVVGAWELRRQMARGLEPYRVGIQRRLALLRAERHGRGTSPLRNPVS